jgi:hypothetical protein
MADLVAFEFLLVYLLSASCLPTEGYPGSSGRPSSSHSWPVQLSGDRSPIFTVFWRTQQCTTASIACIHCSQHHICFKPLATMSTTTILELSPALAMAKKGKISVSGYSTATSVTSFTTTSNNVITKEDRALLATLQECAIHAPPGPHPACTGTRGITNTQQQAECKALKETKLKATEEKKLATAARKAEIVAKKQEKQACLISSAEAKAAKAVAKADKLHAKLAKAASAGVALTPSGRVQAAAVSASTASNKKSKRTAGAPSLSAISALVPQLSLQQKSNMVNKRVSVQSPCQFSLRSDLLSSDCSTNSSSDARVIRGPQYH